MAMGLAKEIFGPTEPEHFIAGVRKGIAVEVKTASEDLKRHAPVAIDENGELAAVKVTASAINSIKLYGITADSAAAEKEVPVYLTGEFFKDGLQTEESYATADDMELAFRNIGIFLKDHPPIPEDWPEE